ncbi:alpha 1,2-mannosyltransferase 2.4.1 [Thoreauomyces humboldtii]|nr:alpha 1,2-mannosyltransferase 2.4.1 [Thoreauomyces humboldtii]
MLTSYVGGPNALYKRVEKQYQLFSSPLPPFAHQRGGFEVAPGERANAAIVVLARNSDVEDVVHTLMTFEATFNAKYRYPYVFLNDKPWTSHFRDRVTSFLREMRDVPRLSPIDAAFGLIPAEHWGYPTHVNQTKARECMAEQQRQGVPYGGVESYHHMCRFQSGFFFKHELLEPFEWYWRLEPDVDYFCPLQYDPFLYMQNNGKKYGFNMVVPEFMSTVPSLSQTIKDYMVRHDITTIPPTLRLMWDEETDAYNGLHFWSNFEIASLSWLRGPGYSDLFAHLDATGNFYYERWGDAPVHSVAAGLLLAPDEIHYFEEIGYRHGDRIHCPEVRERKGLYGPCACDLEKLKKTWVKWGVWAYQDRWRRELERWKAWAAEWQTPERREVL